MLMVTSWLVLSKDIDTPSESTAAVSGGTSTVIDAVSVVEDDNGMVKERTVSSHGGDRRQSKMASCQDHGQYGGQ